MKNFCSTNVTLPEGLPIVITGSTGGIGKEIVRAVARFSLAAAKTNSTPSPRR